MSHSSAKFKVIANALPQSQEQVIARLLAEFDSLPGQLQLCARYIIDHPHEVGLQSMRTLATNAEVQPNSFVRLARHLGFEGYEAMRERFRDFVRGGTGSSPDRLRWLQQMNRKEGIDDGTVAQKTTKEIILEHTLPVPAGSLLEYMVRSRRWNDVSRRL